MFVGEERRVPVVLRLFTKVTVSDKESCLSVSKGIMEERLNFPFVITFAI